MQIHDVTSHLEITRWCKLSRAEMLLK